MKEIQTACADLARHPESYFGRLAGLIAELDAKRDLEHENQLVEKDAQISTQSAELKVVKADNRLLRAKLNKLQDMQFGQKSEKSSRTKANPEPLDTTKTNQTSESFSGIPPKAIEAKPRGLRGRQKVVIPDNVPRDLRIIEPEEGSTCSCGCNMRPLGKQVIERLTFVPAQLRVIEEHYPKYVCRTCDKFVQAPVPKRAFDQTRFDDQLIAGLVVSKFADFIPNYRQEQIFKRSGVQLHRSSMVRMMNNATDALWPVFQALERDLKSSSKLYMDETVLAQLDPGSGKTKTCYVWALCRDDRRWRGNSNPGVVFHFKQSRHGKHAEEILKDFSQKGDLPTETADQIFLAQKCVGYLWNHEVVAASILLSVIRNGTAAARAHAEELLFHPMLLSYGGNLRSYLEGQRNNKSKRIAKSVGRLLDKHDTHIKSTEEVGDVVELQPTIEQRRAVAMKDRDRNRDIQKAAHKRSIFADLATHQTLLYGRKSMSIIHGIDGEQHPQITELTEHSYSVELPRLSVIDPVGFNQLLIIFRARTRGRS